MINELIDGFDTSITRNSENEIIYHTKLLQSLEYSVNENKSIDIIKKKILYSDVIVTLTREDWPLAIAKCESFFMDDSIMLNRVRLLKSKVISMYE